MNADMWRKVLKLDQRIIYLVTLLAIVIPMFFPIGLPLRVGAPARDFYETLIKVPTGKIVVLSAEVAPAHESEFGPVARALFRQLYTQGNLIVVQAFNNAQGPALMLTWANSVIQELGMVYGVDYINLGYRPDPPAMMDNCRFDYIAAFSNRDSLGVPLTDYAMLEGLKKASDIGALVSFDASYNTENLISFWKATGDVQVILGVIVAANVPGEMVRYNAGLTLGIIGAMGGAAQYEYLVGVPGTATQGMDSQGMGHLVVIILIILGNIGYFIVKKDDEKKRFERSTSPS